MVMEILPDIVDCLNQAAHLFGSVFEFDSCQYSAINSGPLSF
jgi:hypothetical protein